MNQDAELLVEIWEYLSVYIPAKDKLMAGETLIKLLDEYGFTEVELYDIINDNKILETSYERYYASLRDDDYEEDEYE